VSTLHCLLWTKKFFKHHASALKPNLAASNKHLRVLHALEKTDPNTIKSRTETMKCQTLCNEIHVAEKWFCACRDGESYVCCSCEDPPERKVGHKLHVTKAMFLRAQARPMQLSNATWWDGKIGIWPIGYHRNTIRDSVNRPAGEAF